LATRENLWPVLCAVEEMGIKRSKPKREKKVSNTPSANTPSADELFVQPPVEMSEDISAVNASSQPDKTSEHTPAQSSPKAENRPVNTGKSNFYITQRVLATGVIISTALMAYSFFFSSSTPSTPPKALVSQSTESLKTEKNPAESNASQVQTEHKQTASSQFQVAQKEANLPATIATDTNQHTRNTEELLIAQAETAVVGHTVESAQKNEPLSLRIADEYFAAKDYVKTYYTCNKLRQNLSGKEFELVKDFLHLRMAICMLQKSSIDKANEMFRTIAESRSITLKVLANYHLCYTEMNSGQYLRARARAYKTIALTGAIASEYKWALSIERNCQFLAAEAIARQTLSLSDTDKELPKQIWYREEEKDPLIGLNEVELQKVLTSGIERFNDGLLAPRIQPVEADTTSPSLTHWSVICSGPGIEELIARFASNVQVGVKWAKRTDDVITTEQQPPSWNRSVTLYLPSATAQQVISTATGAVGLLAQFNDANSVLITDPTEYYVLSEHTRMLNDYSIWLWRKLLLMYSDDNRISNAHFMLGVLLEQKGQTSEAISEYKLVASRYAKTPFAPFALLRSSRLKTNLRDYPGASRDLKQLIEQYPENELTGQAYLNLAETTMKAGMYDQANSQYRKSYSLALSTEAKAVAALGVGKCYYQQKEYEPAMKWLNIYLETVDAKKPPAQKSAKPETSNNPDLYTAYLLLGKTHLALGNLEQACEMLNRTVKKANASSDYAEAIATLAETQIKQKDFVTALNTIENVRPWSFSQEQTTRLLLLKSQILRESGLSEQAIIMLTDRIQYLTDAKLKTSVTLEIARCEFTANHLDVARAYFTDAISSMDAGPDAQAASLELAEICLKLKDYRQTILICEQLLRSSSSEQLKQQASKVSAAAYSSQKDYDKAAMSLLTLSASQNVTKENKTADKTEK
jgi:tetratricopeptide (TPR) repeat protein